MTAVSLQPLTRLDLSLERLRLLLRRRMLWLRAGWGEDPMHGAGILVVSDARADALAAGHDPEAEAAFHRDHPEAAALTEAIAELERRFDDCEEGRLDALVERLALTAFDRELLVLALAPELDPSFARLYAYVADDAGARHASPRLAFDLFGEEGGHGRRLAPHAPLRRLRLLVLDAPTGAGWSERPLRMEERVIDHLRGEDQPEARVATLLRAVDEPAPIGPGAALADRLAAVLAAGTSWPVVHLRGPARTGGRSVAEAVAARLGMGAATLAPGAAAAVAADPELAVLIEREAALLELALLLDDGTRSLASELAAPVLVSGEQPVDAEDVLLVPLEPPDTEARRAMWAEALGPPARPEVVERLVEQFDLEPRQIRAAVAAAASRAALRGDRPAPPAGDDLWDACREQARVRGDGLAQPVAAVAGWEELVLPEHALAQLDELAAQAAHRTRVYDDWGFAARAPRGRGITALFAGASGTGKTMAAEALAVRLRMDIYRIDLAGVVSKWIGETEKNLRSVFDAAENSGAILFFDEAEALFGKRTEVKDSHDRYANIEVDYLQRMEDYRGIAILATNRRSLIDPAFLRRLRFLVDFPFPDATARERLWRGSLPADAPVGEIDLEALARMELSGGSIRTIALNAAFLAADEGAKIGMDQLMRAARREYSKLERLLDRAELGSWT